MLLPFPPYPTRIPPPRAHAGPFGPFGDGSLGDHDDPWEDRATRLRMIPFVIPFVPVPKGTT